MNSKILTKDEVARLLSTLSANNVVDLDYIYEVYESVTGAVLDLQEKKLLNNLIPINPIVVLNYCLGEYFYTVPTVNDEVRNAFIKNEARQEQMIAVTADKYITNEHLSFKLSAFESRYMPPISSIYTYVNFMLSMLTRYEKNVPSKTVIIDILNKAVLMQKCILDLLLNGFETEAFSTWRTLHETESILLILVRYGKPVIDKYLKHINYGIAFRDGIEDKAKQDKVFEEIKSEMKSLDLKSKDMKRFIEYGWLSGIPDVNKIPDFKFNFRDGVERVADLRNYHKWYEMSSEIAHSSPLLIYSKKRYFYYATLINLYESFFRVEKVFATVYLSTTNDIEKEKYKKMQETYYAQLASIYKREKTEFTNFVKGSKSN